jgi:hypothetical protein
VILVRAHSPVELAKFSCAFYATGRGLLDIDMRGSAFACILLNM